MQIDEALARYLVQLEANGRSPHTIGQYRRHVRSFSRWASEVGHSGRVGEVGHEDVARFLSSEEALQCPDGRAKKASSTNALRTSLRTFFRFVRTAGYAETNPARLLRLARCQGPPPRSLSENERLRLMSALEQARGPAADRDHALIHLLLATGIRIGSCLALDVADVDLEAGELLLRATKGGGQERVFLGQAIQAQLRRHLENLRPGPLFRGTRGGRLSTRHVQRRLAFWLERAGIGRALSLHSLRHTFAMDLYQRTRDVFLVKEALGHKSIVSTLVYVRSDRERLQEVVTSEALGAVS